MKIKDNKAVELVRGGKKTWYSSESSRNQQLHLYTSQLTVLKLPPLNYRLFSL